jgi:hypothetical protein
MGACAPCLSRPKAECHVVICDGLLLLRVIAMLKLLNHASPVEFDANVHFVADSLSFRNFPMHEIDKLKLLHHVWSMEFEAHVYFHNDALSLINLPVYDTDTLKLLSYASSKVFEAHFNFHNTDLPFTNLPMYEIDAIKLLNMHCLWCWRQIFVFITTLCLYITPPLMIQNQFLLSKAQVACWRATT